MEGEVEGRSNTGILISPENIIIRHYITMLYKDIDIHVRSGLHSLKSDKYK